MAAFHFQFLPLLETRRARRDACRQVLAGRLRRERELGALRSHRELARASEIERLRLAAAREPFDVGAVKSHRDYAHLLSREIQQVDQETKSLSAELEQARSALTDAQNAVAVLERLEERQRAEFHRECDRRAELELAEAWQNGQHDVR